MVNAIKIDMSLEVRDSASFHSRPTIDLCIGQVWSRPGVYNLFAIAGRIAFILYEVRPPMSSSYIYEILPSANQCCQLFLQRIY